MFKGLANLGSIIKQAKNMGSKLQGLNEELKKKRASGSSGGGMVQVEVNGLGELISIRIEPELFNGGDREMIEDLIPAAANQAITASKQLHAEAMKSMTEGINIPGLSDALGDITGSSPGDLSEIDPTDSETK